MLSHDIQKYYGTYDKYHDNYGRTQQIAYDPIAEKSFLLLIF